MSRRPALLPRLVFALGVTLQILSVEVHVAEVAGGVALRLIVEVLRSRNAVEAAGRHRLGLDAIAEFNGGDEAVAARAVPLLGARIRAGAERRQRTVGRRRE